MKTGNLKGAHVINGNNLIGVPKHDNCYISSCDVISRSMIIRMFVMTFVIFYYRYSRNQ